MNISEMIIEIYLLESALLKTEKLITLNPKESFREQIAMCQNFLHNTAEKIHLNGKEAIYAIATGDEQRFCY